MIKSSLRLFIQDREEKEINLNFIDFGALIVNVNYREHYFLCNLCYENCCKNCFVNCCKKSSNYIFKRMVISLKNNKTGIRESKFIISNTLSAAFSNLPYGEYTLSLEFNNYTYSKKICVTRTENVLREFIILSNENLFNC